MRQNYVMRIKERTDGITLVALVITIVVIIILATVTINFAFGEGGLIRQAEKASEYYANDTKYTEESLANVTAYLNSVLNGSNVGRDDDEELQKSEVAEAIDNNTQYTETTKITDDLENPVWIPGGFHLAEDSGTKVEEGIVIEDNTENKNQFVWIPVGEYNVTADIEKITEPDEKNGKLTNALSRRTFTSTGSTLVNGDDEISTYYYGEGDSRSVAKDQIGVFKTSATNRGGFYIGRYEAGTETERTAETDPLTTPLVQANKYPYVNITRDQAKEQAESMYNVNTSIKATTELISSYAWDTALNFICQTNTKGYELATTTDDAYGNIGTGDNGKTLTGGYTEDCYSNIYDFLGNYRELTTEYSNAVNDSRNFLLLCW